MGKINVKNMLSVTILLLAICTTVVAGDGNLTVGDFLVRIAQEGRLDVSGPAEARKVLNEQGWALPRLDLGARLTEGDVVSIARSAGLNVVSSDPDRPFGATGVQAFLSAFGSSLDPADGRSRPQESRSGDHPDPWDHGADPREKGKGLKKGLVRSPVCPI